MFCESVKSSGLFKTQTRLVVHNFFPTRKQSITRHFFLAGVCWGGSVNGFASLLSSSVVQNGQPETSGSRYQRSNVSLESHSRGHEEGFTSATPRSTERRAKTQLIQRAPDGRCQERSI